MFVALLKMKDFDEAEKVIETALQIRKKIYQTKHHPSYITPLENIGSLYEKKGNYLLALNYFQQTLHNAFLHFKTIFSSLQFVVKNR